MTYPLEEKERYSERDRERIESVVRERETMHLCWINAGSYELI